MAFAKERVKKDGTKYYEIIASYQGDDEEKKAKAPRRYTKYFYPEKGLASRTIKSQLNTVINDFQKAVDAGEILSKAERTEKERAEQEAKAALKTVREYAEKVWMPGKELVLAETTRASYQNTLDQHILPKIGDKLLQDVTTPILKNLILDFQKSGKSLSSARTLHVVLNQLFDSAFQDDLIPISPMLKIPRPKVPKDAPIENEADKAFDADQLNYVLDCVALEDLKWQAYVYLSADTGCRRGELVALKWSDINFKKQTITIRGNAQYTPQKGVYVTTPKNGKERSVDFGDDTKTVLEKYKASLTKAEDKEDKEENLSVVNFSTYQEKQKKQKSLPVWVFTQDNSKEMMFPDSPTRFFKKFGERYGIEDFHPHKLRHSSASIAIRNGADVASVSRRLGHSSIEITMRTYVHATDEGVRYAGQSVRDALKKSKEKSEKKEKAGA